VNTPQPTESPPPLPEPVLPQPQVGAAQPAPWWSPIRFPGAVLASVVAALLMAGIYWLAHLIIHLATRS